MIFFSLAKKNLRFISLLTILIIVAVLFFSWLASGGFSVSFSLLIGARVNQQSSDYQYDGYYAIKATNEFGDTVAQWVKSPEVLNSTYKKAAAQRPKGIMSFFGSLGAQKMAPQYVEVKFRTVNLEDGKKIVDALVSVLQGKAEMASSISGNIIFTILGGEPIITKNQANFLFNGLVALIGGLIVSFFIVLLKENENGN